VAFAEIGTRARTISDCRGWCPRHRWRCAQL